MDIFTNARDYRKSSNKERTVELPSGAKFLVRKVSYIEIFGLGAFLVKDKKQLEEMEKNNREKYIRMFLIKGIVAPKVVDKPKGQCRDDELSVDEILSNQEDALFLMKEILIIGGK